MNQVGFIRKFFAAVSLSIVLLVTGCSGLTQQASNPSQPTASKTFTQIERGNTAASQEFGQWVVQTAGGLIQDAYVRDSNKLGVVISSTVTPNDVQPLASSLVKGMRQSFPGQDLTVLMYAPDKKLVLTAQYDDQSQQIQYQ
jgi:hypothetical protein